MSDLSIHGHHHVTSENTAVQGTHTAKKSVATTDTISSSVQASLIETDPRLIALIPPDEFLIGDMAAIFEARNLHRAQQASNDTTNSETFAKLAETLKNKGETAIQIRAQFDKIIQDESNLVAQQNADINTQQQAFSSFETQVSGSSAQINAYNDARDTYLQAKDNYDQAQENFGIAQNNYDEAVIYYNAHQPPTPEEQEDYDNAVDAYAAATADHNQAQTTYNSALATFNAAIDTYNNYVNSTVTPAVNAYNNSISAFLSAQNATNAQIDAINAERAKYGIPAIDSQNQTTSSASPLPTYAHATSSSTPPAAPDSPYTDFENDLQPVSQPDGQEIITDYYDPLIALFNAQTTTTDKVLAVAQNIDQQRRNNLRGDDPFGSNSFITRHHRISALSVVNAGGGIALGQLSSNDKDTGQEALISKAALRAFEIISTTAQSFAVKEARQSFVPETLKNEEMRLPLGLVFGISNAEYVRNLVDSGNIRAEVAKQVRAEFEGQQADQATIEAAIDVATANVNQRLILTAVAEIGTAINAPGLYGQFLANGAQLTDADLKASAEIHLSAEEVLNDPQKQLFLKSSLSNQLLIDGRTRVDAETIVDSAINFLIKHGELTIRTEEQIKAAILDAFAKQGLKDKEAAQLAEKAAEILRAERSSPQVLYAELFNPALLEKELRDAGVKKASRIATAALDDVISNSYFVTNAEFQIALQDELLKKGVDSGLAAQISQSLVGNVASTPASPLSSQVLKTQLTTAELSAGLRVSVVNALQGSIGLEKAEAFADQTVASLIQSEGVNKRSLLELYNEVTPSQVHEADQVRANTALTFEQRMTLNQHFESSKLFLYIGLSSFGSSEKEFDRKSIDIPV